MRRLHSTSGLDGVHPDPVVFHCDFHAVCFLRGKRPADSALLRLERRGEQHCWHSNRWTVTLRLAVGFAVAGVDVLRFPAGFVGLIGVVVVHFIKWMEATKRYVMDDRMMSICA
jgi:hypothetical protein